MYFTYLCKSCQYHETVPQTNTPDRCQNCGGKFLTVIVNPSKVKINL